MSHILTTAEPFRQGILGSLDQFSEGFAIARGIRVPGEFHTLVVSGMGGSALPASLIRPYLTDVAERFNTPVVPVIENRTYALPLGTATEGHLHLLCSYSGNTEETLSCFEEAVAKQLPCIGVSAGGKLEALCAEKGIPHIKLPIPSPTFQPRMGTGYFIGSFLEVLMNHGLLPDIHEEVLAGAAAVKARLPELEEQGKAMAARVAGKTPVVYSSYQYEPVAHVWKIKINENAKTPAFWNFLPEMNHNEMVGYTLPQGAFHVILLRDTHDDVRNQKRYEVLLPLLAEKGVTGEILDIMGESVYTRIFSALATGDFMAYHLALLYEQEPEPVAMVEAFKKLL
jgi:glucose/mannose-6-phosphate isomerase